MRLVSYEYKGRMSVGVLVQDSVVSLDAIAPDMQTLIGLGEQGFTQVQQIIKLSAESVPLNQVTLLAPIPRPNKNIFALGRNYAEHHKESIGAWGDKMGPPIVFSKAPTSVNAPFGNITIDPAVSVEVDWEVELALIIGKRARKIAQKDALNYVYGYMVLNDVSARDLQNRTSQFFVGKSIDGYCPMGPWIVTADKISDPQNLNLRCRVNGIIKQEGNTRDMIYSIAYIIEDLTRLMTLEPGDIITTGTPAGVGFVRNPPEFLKPGDVLESEVEKIGMLRNKVVGV